MRYSYPNYPITREDIALSRDLLSKMSPVDLGGILADLKNEVRINTGAFRSRAVVLLSILSDVKGARS